MSKKVFVTGISGCVGHYVFDQLIKNKDYELYLLVRNPQKLMFNHKDYPNVHILIGDMEKIEEHQDLLSQIDYMIHIAVDWAHGEPNYQYTLKLFEMLDPNRCKKVIYFSTASILDRDHQPFHNAPKIGTCYIWSKYFTYTNLSKLAIYPKIKVIFPTLVLGGDSHHPFSHVSSGIKKGSKWLKLLRFLKLEGGLHFIHAEDIALTVRFLLENEVAQQDFVLGYDYITIDRVIDSLCRHLKIKRWVKIPLPFSALIWLAKTLKLQVSEWDLFCAEYKHFKYKTVNPSTFGLSSRFQSIESLLEEYL